jgi:hypothetical protein
MNENHARVCTSPEWAQHLQTDILPTLTRDVDLGDQMLEIGPGPGAATEWLRARVGQLTAIEVDEAASVLLAARYAGTNADDSYNPIDPAGLIGRLQTLGFAAITVAVGDVLTFTAAKPASPQRAACV